MLLQSSTRTVNEKTAVVTFTGPLTLGTSLKTADMQLENAIEAGTCWLVLEMSGVPYIDSAGLGLLVHASGLAREHGGDLRLSGVSDRVLQLLRMTHVESLLHIDPDEGSALAAFAVDC